MKDDHIYLFHDIGGVELLVGFSTIKEQFVRNNFIDEPHVLIGLSENLEYRKTILFKKLKNNLFKGPEYTIGEFTNKFHKEIKAVYEYKDNNGISLSWLEVFQIAIMIKDKKNMDEAISQSISKLEKLKKFLEENY
jgi:hypothetical protein